MVNRSAKWKVVEAGWVVALDKQPPKPIPERNFPRSVLMFPPRMKSFAGSANRAGWRMSNWSFESEACGTVALTGRKRC